MAQSSCRHGAARVVAISLALLGCLLATAVFALYAVFGPRVVLVEEHRDPDFRLFVSELQFLGPTHAVHTGAGPPMLWSRVASAHFFGDFLDTAPIDSSTLEFEWHEERHLVALKGSPGASSDSYLALLRWADDGNLGEVPVEPELACCELWGAALRDARSESIRQLLESAEPVPPPGD